MRILLRLILLLLIISTLGLMLYVSFVKAPNEQVLEMIEIPSEHYADKL